MVWRNYVTVTLCITVVWDVASNSATSKTSRLNYTTSRSSMLALKANHDFLLVVSCSLSPTLHHYRVVAENFLTNAFFKPPHSHILPMPWCFIVTFGMKFGMNKLGLYASAYGSRVGWIPARRIHTYIQAGAIKW